jgi:hypothetical protein
MFFVYISAISRLIFMRFCALVQEWLMKKKFQMFYQNFMESGFIRDGQKQEAEVFFITPCVVGTVRQNYKLDIIFLIYCNCFYLFIYLVYWLIAQHVTDILLLTFSSQLWQLIFLLLTIFISLN